MNPLPLAIRNPSVLVVAVIAAVVWGIASLESLPRQEEPTLTWRLANVITRQPGATPDRVEALITDVLERHVEEVDEVEHIYSVSRSGVSLLQIELSDDVTVAAPVWQKVRHKLAEAAAELPADVIGPDLDDEIMGTFAQLIAVTGEGSYRQLKDYAEGLEDRLRYLPSTASTTLFGVQPEVIRVEVDPLSLAAYDLSFDQMAHVLLQRNVKQPAGRLTVNQTDILLEASGEFESERELGEMVLLSTRDGRTLRLGDVATIVRTTLEPPAPLARIDGGRAVVVGVRVRRGRRIDRFGDEVTKIVDSYAKTLPPDVHCVAFHDLAQYTRHRFGQLGRTLLLSVTFVFLSTACFMGWRGASVVTVVIPLTGLIVLACFSLAGIPLNEMSVMAIIMAFGLLVDDAIVVTEQVHRRCGEGVDASQAASEETSRLFVPLVVTSLTTIAAFLPIYLLPGGVGEFVRAIPLGVAICLLAALAVSTTVVPWLCAKLLKTASIAPEQATNTPRLRLITWIVDRYRELLQWTVARPTLSIVLTVAIMGALAALGLTLRRDFFSPVERDQFVVDVFAPQGATLSHTAEVVAQVEAVIAEQTEVASTAAFIGRNAPLIFYNLESQETYANHFAQLVVRVDGSRHTSRVASRVQAELQSTIADAHCCVHILEHGAPLIAPFEIRISGPSTTALRELGRRAADILRQTPGVRNIRDNYGNETLKLITQVNEPVARRAGIDQSAVAGELRRRLDGITVSHMREGDEHIAISLRLPKSDREDVSDLRSVYFKPSADSGLIPFTSVASLSPSWETSSIYRRDGERTLSVLAYPQFGLTAAQLAKDFAPRLEALRKAMPAGYALQLGGENEQRGEAESNLLAKGGYAVLLIVLLLTYEFRSMRLAALILIVVPLSLGGVMLGLFVTGWPLNFMAIMGMMVLFGVVINDAVILVDGFERRRRADAPDNQLTVEEMVVQGTLERARHVVITTVTTVAGFLPLALSPSLLWPPLAIAIIGGISCSTILTLVAIPAAYLLLRPRLNAA